MKLHYSGLRDLKEALAHAVNAYNGSVHSSHGLSPLEAEKPENLSVVLQKSEQKRYATYNKYLKKIEKLNRQFKIGQEVRIKLARPSFAKESTDYFSTETYEIIGIVPSGPLKGYKLREKNSTGIVPGSFLPEHLLAT